MASTSDNRPEEKVGLRRKTVSSDDSFPADYVIPAVWGQFEQQARTFSGMNRPTAGPRTEENLPIGEHPLQLYSLATPNGKKVTILLEELGIEYDAWIIKIMQQKQFTTGFCEINPNAKIPALADYDPENRFIGSKTTNPESSMIKPLRVFESGSILLYLADKYKKFIPQNIAGRTECLNWLFWLQGEAPYVGGGFVHFFHYAPVKIKYAVDRYTMEVKRAMDLLDNHLADGRTWICGENYTIADMAIMPWFVPVFTENFGAGRGAKFVGLDVEYENLKKWTARVLARPAVQRGIMVNSSAPGGVKNRHSKNDFPPGAYSKM